MKIEPFTKTNYPSGYSRNDCLEQLKGAEAQLAFAKEQVKAITKEVATLRKELKQGGRIS